MSEDQDAESIRKLAEGLGSEAVTDWCPDLCSCGQPCFGILGHRGPCACLGG